MPLVNRTFDQLIDFTRTSAATFVNSSGNIASTPQSRNLLTFTNEFANAAWTKTRCTIIPNVNPAAASLGSELVTNGDFASGTTGWSAANSATLSNSSNRLSVVNGATALGQARSTITTVPGRIYRVAATFTSVAGSRGSVFVGTFAGDNSLFSDSPITASRSVTGYFVATGTTTHIAVGVADNTLALEVLFDDISVREVVGGALQAPDGTFTADKVIANTETNYHVVRATVNPGTAAVNTFSIYAKAAEYTRVHLGNISTTTWGAAFDLSNGTVIATYGSGITPSITSVGNGWYRCSVTFSGVASGWSYGVIGYPAGATLDAAGAQYTGDGVSGIFIWGAQLEFVPDASLTLGSELVSNGTFDSATGWTVGTGWAIGSGVASAAGNTAGGLFTSSAGYTTNRTYRVELTKTGSANLAVYIRGGAVASTTASGTVVLYVTAGSSSLGLEFYLNGAGSIDNVSAKEVTGTVGYPTDYTRNFGGLFPPRFDYDPVTRAPRGLLIEEQRTNLLLRSEEFDNAAWFKGNTTVTANAVVSPDGTVDADQVDFAAVANANIQAASAISVTPGTAYTFSVYVRAAAPVTNVNLSLQGTDSAISVGTSWTRVSMTVTASGSTLIPTIVTRNSVAATIFVWGAQLEAGAFATSYIPTVASQVTRTADSAVIQAPNFASWFNQPAGTFVVEASTLYSNASDTGTIRVAFTADDGTTNNVHRVYHYTNRYGGSTIVGGVSQTDMLLSTIAVNTPAKVAYAYAANDFSAAMGGVLGTPDTSGSLPTPTRLSFGGLWNVNGHIRSLRYYPTRLTNAQLQALTA